MRDWYGVAVLEDIALWLALAVATALAGKTALNPGRLLSADRDHRVFRAGAHDCSAVIKEINKARFNVFAKNRRWDTRCGVDGLLRGGWGTAGQPGVRGFPCWFCSSSQKKELFSEALDAIKVAFAFFIPIYFAIVGLKLDLIRGVSLWMIVAFVVGTCVVKILSVSLAGRFAGFRGLDLINLAITTNARGGPGIVLASVAFDAGIISAKFYTTLVIAAVLTSQFAGAWLDYVLRRGWPLLSAASGSQAKNSEQEDGLEVA